MLTPGTVLVSAMIGYLLGSIPFGLLLSRMKGLGDIRKIGSGNIGATNVLRTGHKKLALLTLLFDALKGTVAVLLVSLWHPEGAAVAGFCAVIGHVFPLWLGFQGGKGAATALGVLIALNPLVALLTVVTWAVVAFVFRYSSLASLLSVLVAPFFAIFLAPDTSLGLTLVFLAALIVFTHRSNIQRLLHHQEPKIGQKPKT